MSNFFPRWSNFLPIKLAIFLVFAGVGVVFAMTYLFTGKYTRVGYMPSQPVAFDHSIHVGQLGLDCRYCHSFVEVSPHSNVPTTQTCFNCHSQVQQESPKLEPVRRSMETREPIDWVQVHQTPDYVYFDHSVHVSRGVSCRSCHGKINEMETVYHDQPHTMGWCLNCHRAPEKHLRPIGEVVNLDWKPADEDREDFYRSLATQTGREHVDLMAGIKEKIGGADKPDRPMTQKEIGAALKDAWGINPPEDCAGCHR